MTDRSPVRLDLYNAAQNGGGFLLDATRRLQGSWKRSIRDVGGYWLGTAEWDGDISEMLDVFQNGMQWELRETAGGLETWRGFLAQMELTYRGQLYRRDWTRLANRVKTIYSKVGTNLISNPSCETTVWDAYGTPATRERSNAWATEGSYSAHIVTDAADEGVVIAEPLFVTAGAEYQGHITLYVESGAWRVEVYGSASIDYSEIQGTGAHVLYFAIPPENQITTIGVRLYCVDAAGECYADAAVLQLAPTRAETSWYDNTASQSEYGAIEEVLLMGGMTDAAAVALSRTTLANRAWARTIPPKKIEISDRPDRDKLELTFLGYVYTLRNKHSRVAGEDAAASDVITSLLSEAQFVSAGSIQSNALEYHIDDREAYRAWNLIRDVTLAGDAAGNRWTCGVYAGRRFVYERASASPVARLRGGRVTDPAGGPLQGWFAQPGLVALDDMPHPHDYNSDRPEDGNRYAWMSEVEFDLGEYLEGLPGITYRETAI
jgi:hypothetical protein